MSAPLQDVDFLTANWETLTVLARKDNVPFPAALPALSAVAFDRVKDAVSAYRGWELYSVDAVTVAEDGRIFFIEFKDVTRNPIAWLKKKGFDSLFLFWLAIGTGLTMDEIRDRAVFCYVSTNVETRFDDMFGRNLEIAGGDDSRTSNPDQLDELRNTGLFGAVMGCDPGRFCANIQDANVAQTVDEVKGRLSTRYRLPTARPPVPQVCQNESVFSACVLPIAQLRMVDPFDPAKHKAKATKEPNVLRLADVYDDEAETMSYGHDWSQRFPVMCLMACCFDSFMMWCLAYHAGDRFDTLGNRLKGEISFVGDAPAFLPEPPTGMKHEWLRRFWTVYAPYYRDIYGLVVFENKSFYQMLTAKMSV